MNNAVSDGHILEPGEDVDENYGVYELDLTREQLSALIAGKRVCFTVAYNEYTIVLESKTAQSED